MNTQSFRRHPASAMSFVVAAVLILAGSAPLWAQSAAAKAPAAASAKAATPAPAEPKVVSRSLAGDAVVVKLDNGLTVIVKPMHTAPVVCVRCYVHTGAIYEGKWLGCGLSHLCEHLVAETQQQHAMPVASNGMTASREITSDIGGQSNASTSSAVTQYYISAASGKAMQCIDLIAGWMARPKITKKAFEREHGVVQRELELGKDDPDRQMWYAHAADAFHGSPAAMPVIGFAKPLAAVTYDDVIQYHAQTYVPQNMVFVVAGDVDVEAAIQRVCKAFTGFSAGREPNHDLPEVKPLPGVVRREIGHTELKDTMEEMSFRSVSLFSDDLYPLDVLDGILSTGQNSRLVSKLLRQRRLVTSISASSYTPAWGKGIFNVSFRCEPAQGRRSREGRSRRAGARGREGRDADELERAKKQIIASFVYAQQSVESVSSNLGSDYISTGDAAFSQSYTRRIANVTAEQVQAAAKKYITPDRIAITRMVPAGDLPPIGAAAAKASKSKTVAITLPNGLRAVLTSTNAVDLVSMAFVTKGGLMVETPETNGMGSLMTSLSTKGAGDRSADDIANFFAGAGGSISGSCGNNTFYWQASVLKDGFDGALSILADVVQRPTFPKKELEILRPRQLAAIDRIDEDWGSQLFAYFRREFFTDSPLRFQTIGSKAVVEKATDDAIRKFHDKYVLAGDSVLTIFGNFDADDAAKRIRKLFGGMKPGKIELDDPAGRHRARRRRDTRAEDREERRSRHRGRARHDGGQPRPLRAERAGHDHQRLPHAERLAAHRAPRQAARLRRPRDELPRRWRRERSSPTPPASPPRPPKSSASSTRTSARRPTTRPPKTRSSGPSTPSSPPTCSARSR